MLVLGIKSERIPSHGVIQGSLEVSVHKFIAIGAQYLIMTHQV